MEYRKISKENKSDLRLANEPFALFGRMIVERTEGQWQHRIELFHEEEVESMVFPEEDYVFAEIEHNGFAIGAYDQDECIGLAIYQFHWNKYLYLYDLKVNSDFRQLGVAQNLIAEGLLQAKELGYKGMYTVGQDNNLAACKFYLKQGFVIGGLNTQNYTHTQQKGKSDIYFYLEAD